MSFFKKPSALGWDNANDALKFIDNEHFKAPFSKVFKDPIQIQFSYQNGKWLLNKVVRTNYNMEHAAISSALGKIVKPSVPFTEEVALRFNQKWLALIQ